MKAIYTKYIPPTNTKPARISAEAEGGAKNHRAVISYPHEYNHGTDAHAIAAIALCKKMQWAGKLIGGSLKDGCVFVFAPTKDSDLNVYNIPEA